MRRSSVWSNSIGPPMNRNLRSRLFGLLPALLLLTSAVAGAPFPAAAAAGRTGAAVTRQTAELPPQTPDRQPPGPRDELPLPAVPSTLREPQRRAAYILNHFWDAMDFADTLRTRDRRFMEQNFANYLSLFPHADTAALVPAVERLLHAAAGDRRTVALLTEIAEKYLYEPASPMYDEIHYARFLRALLRTPYADAAESLRCRYRLAAIRRNSPGTRVADFRYRDRQGRRRTLRRTPGRRLLLIFYDPACAHCIETMERLAHDASLRARIDAGELTVLALFADGDEPEWMRSVGSVPAAWHAGLDLSGVQEHELYVLRELPALYLLDEKKKVILKDTDPERIRAHFEAR